MRRWSVLAITLLAIGCSSHSGVVPGPINLSPQVFQKKQPFTNPWLVTHLGVTGAAPSALVAQGKYVWVADSGAAFLSRVSMRQGSKNFKLNVSPLALAFGSDKSIWVATGREIIARVTPAGVETDFTVSAPGAITDRIISGPDGALWYTVWDQDGPVGIGRIDTNGNYTIYPYRAGLLTSGPDGNIWFFDGTNLNAMNTQGQIVAQYPFSSGAMYSTIGPDGAMWFTDSTTLTRVTTAGQITTFQSPIFGLYDIASYGGQLWMTNNSSNGNMLLPFNPATQIWGDSIPSPFTTRRIVTGTDRNFWMTGPTGSIVTYVNQILSVTPTSLTLKTGKSGTLTVSETNFGGTWSAVWPSQIVNVVQKSPGVFTVTGVALGSGKVTIQDTMHNYTKIPITVQ